MTNLKALAELAAEVAADKAARDEAFAEERAAAIELLTLVMAAVAPAMPALASPVLESLGYEPHSDEVVRRFLRDEDTNKITRGVVLATRNWQDEPKVVQTSAARLLFLPGEGRYLEQLQSSSPEEDGYWWVTDCNWYDEPSQIIERGWRVEAIVDHLNAQLQQQAAGNSKEKTREAKARAEKLRAIATLTAPPARSGARGGAR